jgi:hypothetical protein
MPYIVPMQMPCFSLVSLSVSSPRRQIPAHRTASLGTLTLHRRPMAPPSHEPIPAVTGRCMCNQDKCEKRRAAALSMHRSLIRGGAANMAMVYTSFEREVSSQQSPRRKSARSMQAVFKPSSWKTPHLYPVGDIGWHTFTSRRNSWWKISA